MTSQHDVVQQNAQAAAQANFDAKKYICGPWLKGARGGPWDLVFKPSFEEALRKIKAVNIIYDDLESSSDDNQ